MSVSVVQVGGGQPARRQWASGICGGTADMGICCYVLFCPICAAGDVAQAAGNSYCVSCCLMLGLSAAISPIICAIGQPIIRANDRTSLARVHNIDDGLGCCGACMIEFLGWGLGIPLCCCLLCQELYTIKTYGLRYPTAAMTASPQIIVIQGAAPQQQVMYAQPQGFAQQPPQYAQQPQYAPQYPQQQQYPPQQQQYPPQHQQYPPQQQQYPPQQQQYPPQSPQQYPPQAQQYPQAQYAETQKN